MMVFLTAGLFYPVSVDWSVLMQCPVYKLRVCVGYERARNHALVLWYSRMQRDMAYCYSQLEMELRQTVICLHTFIDVIFIRSVSSEWVSNSASDICFWNLWRTHINTRMAHHAHDRQSRLPVAQAAVLALSPTPSQAQVSAVSPMT